MKKQQKGTDYSPLLIWAAALVTVVRYAAAFIASDVGQIDGALSQVITWLMGFSGLGMGILDVLGGTYLFDGWRRAMPASGKPWTMRFRVLTFFVLALMGTGVMILVPFTESRVLHTSLSAVLGDGGALTWWALLVNLAPYLLIGGVAVGNQVVAVSLHDGGNLPESGRKVSDDGEESYRKVSGNWRKARAWLSDEEVAEIARLSGPAIAEKYHLGSERTGRNWRNNAIAELQARKEKAVVNA